MFVYVCEEHEILKQTKSHRSVIDSTDSREKEDGGREGGKNEG